MQFPILVLISQIDDIHIFSTTAWIIKQGPPLIIAVSPVLCSSDKQEKSFFPRPLFSIHVKGETREWRHHLNRKRRDCLLSGAGLKSAGFSRMFWIYTHFFPEYKYIFAVLIHYIRFLSRLSLLLILVFSTYYANYTAT